MRKIILSLHTTLDGFVAGTNGEMDWIKLDAELFDLVGELTAGSDTALYGRITYEMMENYWPTAADQPNATKHDIEHSRWYSNAAKVVLSRTLDGKQKNNTTVISNNIPAEIEKLKKQEGKHIIIFGSPSVAHTLMAHNLIDEYWLFINPIILSQGIPLFANTKTKIPLKPLTTKVFPCGVTALSYSVVR